MSDEYRTLLLDAYKGEVLGEALFGAFAARESGDRAVKLRVLARRLAMASRHGCVAAPSHPCFGATTSTVPCAGADEPSLVLDVDAHHRRALRERDDQRPGNEFARGHGRQVVDLELRGRR